MLKKFIEGVKDVLPAIGGTLGYAIAGPAGAAIGSGLGSLVRGDPGQEAFENALLAGSIGAGGQRFLSGGEGPIGQFFAKGRIPGVVGGDTGILRAFSERNFSPTMRGFGFGDKYLPVEPEVSARMIGANTPVYDTATGQTVMTGGQTISGDTLAEFDRLKNLGTGTNDMKLLEMARENVLGGEAGGDTGILSQVFDFAKTNPELVIGGGILLKRLGFFDEGELDDLPDSPTIGSQGSLNTGLARLINPVLNPDGTYTFPTKDGGIMRAKEGKQAKKFLVGPDDLEEFLNDPSRFIQTSPNAPKIYDRDQKFKVLEKLGIVGRAAEGMLMERKFNPDGGFQEMKEGNIASFQENSPRRDLFLERDGPISDDRGSPDKDTVFAKLADGEFVVNADTVADIGYGMGAKNLDQAKEMGGSFFYGLQDAQKKGILGNMVGMA